LKLVNTTVVYVLWLREMKRFLRAKSRVIGSLAMPLFFLAFLGMGFNRMAVPGLSGNVNYIQFLVPGILGMSLLFSSTFGGLSVLWDREFGFLKEIMVAPVNRVSIVLGRIAGGMTTALIQGLMILGISVILGFKVRSLPALALALAAMLLITITFLGLGLIFASVMKDMQGFSIVMNFVIFPIFFLSGALYPMENLPKAIRVLSYADPLTYGIDGLRGVLLGVSSRPPAVDIVIMASFSIAMVLVAAYAFEKSECA
jgi:ABC-2 type transport system permease protein